MASPTHRFLPSEHHPEDAPIQAVLPLPVARPADPPLIPARTLTESAYCPRPPHLAWVPKVWCWLSWTAMPQITSLEVWPISDIGRR